MKVSQQKWSSVFTSFTIGTALLTHPTLLSAMAAPPPPDPITLDLPLDDFAPLFFALGAMLLLLRAFRAERKGLA